MHVLRGLGMLSLLAALGLASCRRGSTTETEQIQDAGAKPIIGAFGKNLGELWPELPTDAKPEMRNDLYVFAFNPSSPLPELTRYRAWVLPATRQICRLTAAGEIPDEKAFADFFQGVESRFGHLAPLKPAESFQPRANSYWSAARDGRTVLVVRRKDGRTTLDLFDVFLGSRPLEEILSAKGAQIFDY